MVQVGQLLVMKGRVPVNRWWVSLIEEGGKEKPGVRQEVKKVSWNWKIKSSPSYSKPSFRSGRPLFSFFNFARYFLLLGTTTERSEPLRSSFFSPLLIGHNTQERRKHARKIAHLSPEEGGRGQQRRRRQLQGSQTTRLGPLEMGIRVKWVWLAGSLVKRGLQAAKKELVDFKKPKSYPSDSKWGLR